MHLPNQRLGKPDKLSQGAHSQTSYPKVQWENTLDKRELQNPSQRAEQRAEGRDRDAEREREREGESSQEITGNMETQSRNIPEYTHAAGG